jgi:hypothetical protein
MNSIFAMDYLNDHINAIEDDRPGISGDNLRLILSDQFENSTVLQVLRSLDYQIVTFDSAYKPLEIQYDFKVPDKSFGFELSFFEVSLLEMTPFPRMSSRLMGLFTRLQWRSESQWARKVKHSLSLHDYNVFNPPIFVYNHVLTPHPPFDLDRDGKPRFDEADIADGTHRTQGELKGRQEYHVGYLEKLRFTNTAVLEYLLHVLQVPGPKIVVVHGDHGGGMFMDHEDHEKSCIMERFGTLLAVYASDGNLFETFGPDVNLVNLYREIFSTVFDAQLPSLEKHSYLANWDDPTDLKEIPVEQLNSLGSNCSDSVLALPTVVE